MTAEDWTAVGTVSLSLLTLIALLVSIVLARANFAGLRSLEMQLDQNKKLISIEEKRDMQAYKISGWFEIGLGGSDISGRAFGSRKPTTTQIYNGSNQPIYQVQGKIWKITTKYTTGEFREVQAFDLGTVPPNTKITITLDLNYKQAEYADYKQIYGENKVDEFSKWMADQLEISFLFRDSEESWWERDIHCLNARLEGDRLKAKLGEYKK